MTSGIIITLTFFIVLLVVWRALDRISHQKRRAVERRCLDGGGIELELADGSRWRTGSGGFVWHHFPSGVRAHLELEFHLDEEDDRLRLLSEWSES